MAGTQKLGIQKHRAVLALGSNLGESEDTLERAIADLVASGVQLVRASGLYRTAPVGGPAGQPDFVNAVIEVTTDLAPTSCWHCVTRWRRRITVSAWCVGPAHPRY